MATNNSFNSQYSNNSDGFTLTGGTTARGFSLTGGNVTVTGSGSGNTYTMPASSDTLVGRASSDVLTNKDLTSSTNTFPSTVIGYTSISSNFVDSTTGAYVDVTSGSVTVTAVSGRGLKITAFYGSVYCSASTATGLAIREGTTTLNKSFVSANSLAQSATVIAYVSSPTAGSHTYKMSVEHAAGTLTVQSNTANPAVGQPGITFIMVELV